MKLQAWAAMQWLFVRVVVVSLQNPQGRQGVTGNPLSPLHQEPCVLWLLCTTLVPGVSPVAALFLFICASIFVPRGPHVHPAAKPDTAA